MTSLMIMSSMTSEVIIKLPCACVKTRSITVLFRLNCPNNVLSVMKTERLTEKDLFMTYFTKHQTQSASSHHLSVHSATSKLRPITGILYTVHQSAADAISSDCTIKFHHSNFEWTDCLNVNRTLTETDVCFLNVVWMFVCIDFKGIF